MGKILLILIVSLSYMCNAYSQSITVDDLLTLSSLSPKNIDGYLNKKGFVSAGKSLQDDLVGKTFVESKKVKSKDTSGVIRSISLYKKENIDYYVLHTSSVQEYRDGSSRLKKAGFFSDSSKGKEQPGQCFFKKEILV